MLVDEIGGMDDYELDGLVGLGFKTLSEGYPTLLDNL